MQVMHNSGWLSRQPETFRNDVLRSCLFRTYKSGEVLYHVEDEASGVFGLVAGVIETQLPNGRIATVGSPGYWIGEAAAFRRRPRGTSLIAKTDVQVFYLPLAEFNRLIANAEYCRCFALLTIEHLEEAVTVVGNLMISDAMMRICARLLTLSSIENRGGDQMTLTQADLASMCGLTRSTVNKSVGRLIKEGVVSSTYGRIAIIDAARLRALARPVEHPD
jgi:CRP/FNR family transcriptional regulator, cyclic AMP receptor protein